MLLEEGEEHYALWKHLSSMIIDGKQNAFLREYGKKLFEYTVSNPPYTEGFNEAMSSYSSIQTVWISEALDGYDFFENTACVRCWWRASSLALQFTCEISPTLKVAY